MKACSSLNSEWIVCNQGLEMVNLCFKELSSLVFDVILLMMFPIRI